jgi:anti-sigma factor RsiW
VKGKLSQQDLTDYALNELSPNERLYVESMLAVSEEYRNDIYENIDIALMLEEGFEREEEKMPALLTEDQRHRVLSVEVSNRFFHRAAALLSAAAAIALALFNHDMWLPKGSASQMALVSNYVVDAVSSTDDDDLATRLANFRRLAEDPGFKKWFAAQPVTSPQGFSAATQSASWGGAPRALLDFR